MYQVSIKNLDNIYTFIYLNFHFKIIVKNSTWMKF